MKKTDLKLVALVMAGVVAAGFLMNQFEDIGIVSDAKRGFG
ncbi:hypothetical protein [uncultured Celeribacter sp.]|nr:hypothetical protein [uncultured Celeribacter sp.]